MRIAICDDEKYFRKMLINQLSKYSDIYNLDFSFQEFIDGHSLLYSNISFDLIFLDYQMDGIDGLETIELLRKRNDETKVIFVSSYKEIVFDSLKYQAFRFLVKPVQEEKLFESLDSFFVSKKSEHVIIVNDKYNQNKKVVKESTIIYAEADNIYSKIRTEKEYYTYNKTLSELEKTLKSDFFYRSHRSFLINFTYIKKYSNTDIVFENGEKAALTKTKYAKFQKAYMSFLRRERIGINQ